MIDLTQLPAHESSTDPNNDESTQTDDKKTRSYPKSQNRVKHPTTNGSVCGDILPDPDVRTNHNSFPKLRMVEEHVRPVTAGVCFIP